MAIQWADDFSRYGLGDASNARMLDGLPYAVLSPPIGSFSNRASVVRASPDPSDTVPAFRLGNNPSTVSAQFRVALPTVVTGTVGVCLRAWLEKLPAIDAERPWLIGTLRTNAEYLVYLRIEQNGALTVVGRVAGVLTQIATTTNPVVQPSSFNHYEFTHDRATGAGEVYVNGVLRLSYSGVDTADNIVFISLAGSNSTSTPSTGVWIKDLFIWDSTGSQNNSVAGTVIVRRLKPNGDVTLGGWVPSVGTTAFNLLAKDTPDDATFISADDTPPAPVSVTLENLPPDVTSVRGLLSVARIRKIDGGDGNVQTALSPNGTDWDDGADRPATTAFTYSFDVSELDPASATPWSPVAVDSAELRLNRTL